VRLCLNVIGNKTRPLFQSDLPSHANRSLVVGIVGINEGQHCARIP